MFDFKVVSHHILIISSSAYNLVSIKEYIPLYCLLIKLILLKGLTATLIFHDFNLALNSFDRFLVNIEEMYILST